MVELRLERMVHGGVALARLPEGRVVLVEGGIPGERVTCEVQEVGGVLRGHVQDVVEASADRVPAPAHPGLDYGFVRYERQLELKREVVEDALRRALGKAVEAPPVRPSPAVFGYRSAVQPAVADGGLGYRVPRSDEIVALERDPVANAAIQRAWSTFVAREAPAGIVEVAFRGNGEGEVLVALIATVEPRALLDFAHELVRLGFAGVSLARFDPRGRFRGGAERLAGARSIVERYGRHELTVTATSFAQPNPAAAGQLYVELEEWAPGGDRALDLYAGGGAIALHLAPRYSHVMAIEIDRASVVRGQRDAARLGVDNVEFVRHDARRVRVPEGLDLLCVDPPRAGLKRELRDAVASSGVQRILYVSCDVATWARDVADFSRRGFELERFRPYDFYPHTHHVEILSSLRRTDA